MGAGASKQMYDKLTVNYSALFRTMTPLYFDLQDEDNSIFIGKSTFLKEAFTTLQTQVLGFCKRHLIPIILPLMLKA
jgi:hypothetical protein